MAARRAVFAALVLATMAGLAGALALVLSEGGLAALEIVLVALFALNTPWLCIGFWNAVIGVALPRLRRDWLAAALPLRGLGEDESPVASRVAIVMPVRNEDAGRAVGRLRAAADSLDAAGHGGAFAFFLLSDTDRPAVAAAEERLFARWRAADPRPDRLHYRRRARNTGLKAGNIADFCDRWGGRFDHMVVLDADSAMTGAAILRIVRLMEANPRLGILQTLVTGLPSAAAFARVFQFGMRHGMRAYTLGSAWWQGDHGPYWGHNAIVRLAPFRAHCRLPRLPGAPPLGGDVLSHDQVEAALMRGAGWEVRVLPVEGGSFEDNPPTLQDYLKRDLRWCQGNMQYLRLLAMPGVLAMGRLQLLLAILMYASAPVWYAFMATGLAYFAFAVDDARGFAPTGPGVALFAIVLALGFAPKILGVLDLLSRPAERRRYGGGRAAAAGALVEAAFSMLLAPVAALAQTVLIAGLFLGRRIAWDGQRRDPRRVSWREAAGALWPQTLAGIGLAGALAALAPGFLPWAAPVVLGLSLAIPFAVATARPGAGRALARSGCCAIPEEIDPPAELRRLGLGAAATPPAPEEGRPEAPGSRRGAARA